MSFRPYTVYTVVGALVGVVAGLTPYVSLAAQTESRIAYGVRQDTKRTASRAREVTLVLKGVTLKQALDEIARQSGTLIAIGKDALLDARRIDIAIGPVSAITAVRAVLRETKFVAKLTTTGQLMIVNATNKEGSTQAAGVITGRVTDSASGRGLAHVTVTIAGTKLATLTNDSGRYVLRNVPDGVHSVVARLVGYVSAAEKVTVADGRQVTANIVLRTAPTVLSQVITTATGEQQRLEVGNSVTRLNVDSVIKTAPITSVTDLLDGRIPGLVVQRGSGAPGAPSRVRIRGISSISGSSDPIIVVDGVRVYSAQTGTMNDANFSVLDRMDINTIDFIDVLRGPSASALYGSDAANGVIVIKTKRGQPGTTRWTVSSDQQITTQPRNFPTSYYLEGREPIGGRPIQCYLDTGCTDTRLIVFNPLNDSRTTIFGHGLRQNYVASVEGGSSLLQYFVSGQTTRNQGPLKMSDADVNYLETFTGVSVPRWQRRPQLDEQLSGLSRISLRPAPTLALDLTGGINRSIRSTTPLDQGVLYSLQGRPADTSLIRGAIGDFRRRTMFRELAWQNTANVNWDIAPWWHVGSDAGVQTAARRQETLIRRGDCLPGTTCGGFLDDTTGRIDLVRGDRSAINLNLRSGWRVPRRFGVLLTPTIGAQYVRTRSNDLTLVARDLPLGSSSVTGAGSIGEGDSDAPREVTLEPVQFGLFASTGVALFNERLFTSFGTRVDASNSLGTQVRPTYPKLDISYLVSRESFFPADLASLRLRLAYGHSAVQPDIGAALRTYRSGFGAQNGVAIPVATLSGVGNPNLRPERSTEFEGGFDLGVLQDRVTVSLTQFRKLSRDAIVTEPLPLSIGGVLVSNLGSVRNTGVEVTAEAVVIDRAALRWSVNTGISRFRNVLVKLSPSFNTLLRNLSDTEDDKSLVGRRYVEGYPLNGVWMRPVLSYADVNGDHAISSGELLRSDSSVFVGGPLPDYDANFGTQVGLWQGRVSLAAQMSYQSGMSQANQLGLVGNYSVRTRELSDPLTPLSEQAAARSWYTYVHTVSTLRFNTLSVRVQAPATVTRRFRAKTMSVALQGSNLGLWTTYSGADPNVNSSIVGNAVDDTGVIPQPRTWGLNVSLTY